MLYMNFHPKYGTKVDLVTRYRKLTQETIIDIT